MNVVSLFSGIAGLDIAVEAVTGGSVVAHCEIDPAASKVLAARFPDVPNLGDATVIDWTPWVGQVDIVCGGFMCTDISKAGQRAGITEESRSGVTWSALVRAVRHLRPRLVLLENVGAIVVRGLDVVAADVAACGYDLRWTCVRASDIGAPHQRLRWFAVAYLQGEQVGAAGFARAGRRTAAADADGAGPQGHRRPVGHTREQHPPPHHQPAWGEYGPAIARWERIIGRPAPPPTDDQGRLDPPFVEWMQGLPAGWTDVGISRTARLRALGNCVVPRQAIAAYLALHSKRPPLGVRGPLLCAGAARS